MGVFRCCLKTDLRRALINKGVLAAVCLSVIIQLQAVIEELLMPGGDVIYYFTLTLGTGYM